jgi:hypothetical protein
MTDLPENSYAELSARVAQLETKLEQVISLLSDVPRYGKLRELLEEQKWQEADIETTKVMLEVAGHTDQDELTPDDILKFPCSVIQVIDQLWSKYSDNRFGFSIQQQVYLGVGGTDDISSIDMEILQKTGEIVGWRANNKWISLEQLDFSLNAPPGCHPSGWWRSAYGAKMAIYFLSRLIRCNS